ncbi:MAG: T9SS type A sorting domain-containing protein [Opitutaceae bacterium]|nr:T9SS type A sorting domain-containing protein [Cytophagales bacterium]
MILQKKFSEWLFSKYFIIVISGLLLLPENLQGQSFKYLNDSSLTNFYQIRLAFETDWFKENGTLVKPNLRIDQSNQEITGEFHEKENEYIHFKRWESFVAPRVYPSGDISLISSTYDNFKSYKEQLDESKSNFRLEATPAWSFVGPSGTNDNGRNAGRMNFVRFDPKNTNTIYAGAPAGGLWKSLNAGGLWKPISDFLPSIGCSDLGIDPVNTDILYLATGDNDGGSTKSIGIMKSVDGGTNWLESGLKWTPNQNRQISRVLINPVNPQIIMCFGSQGVYRSINGGTNWTQILVNVGYIKDAELKPGDPNIVYAVSNRLYRSSDGGATFIVVNGGTPTADLGRMSLDVTPANPNYVYLLAAKGNGDFKGLYRSDDSGVNFTLRSDVNTPNVLGYSATYGSGNQTGYDMAFSANKVNAELLVGAGVRNWKSIDGGITWTVATQDCQTASLELHWDIHYLEFMPGSTTTAFAACDGGVYRTVNTGSCWSAINQNNISVNQIYGFGVASDNPEIMISGHQDGATVVHTNGTYRSALGGDGFQAFVDRTNSKILYGELYFGGFSRSINGGLNWTWLADNPGLVNLDGAWNTPWCQDPIDANSLWTGYDQVLKSTDKGDNWTQVGALPGNGKMRDVKVAPSDNKVVYVARPRELYITRNNGTLWTNITAGLPVLEITCIAIGEKDPLHAWVTCSGYAANQKVYETFNGGTSWASISAGLPNLPVNCIQYVPGSSNNEIYIGCDVGVYYKNSTINTWVPYFEGLAYTPVFDIEIYSKGKEIRVATHGRGIWKAPLYVPTVTALENKHNENSEINYINSDIFTIYPNPVENFVMVVAPGSLSAIKLLDLKGRQLTSPEFESTGLVVLSNLSKGVYFIEVEIADGRKWVKKIVKQ